MDKNELKMIELQIEECKRNLELHGFKVSVCDNSKQVIDVVDTYLEQGVTIGHGGSETLREVGLLDYLRTFDNIHFLDREKCDNPIKCMKDSLLSDVYLMSSNAVTLDGQLYNVDGRGNRVSALTFGPEHVLCIVGYNKLVKDIESADKRVKYNAAISNNIRLNRVDNPCVKIGHCVDCNSDTRICATKVITSRSMVKDRIHVILVKEKLGY